MSKTTLIVTGLVLAVVGFGAGHYVGSSPGLREAPPDATPLPPGQHRNAILDVMQRPDLFSRVDGLVTLLPTLGPEAIPDVQEALKALHWTLPRAAEVSLLVHFWATHDPKEATRWVFETGGTAYYIVTSGYAMEIWAKKDPKAAAQFLRATGQSQFGNSEAAEIGLVRGWFASGLPGLENYIRDLGVGIEQQRALGIFAREKIARDGVEATLSWLEALPDEPKHFKLAAFRRVGSELGKVDPIAAAAWCDKHCEGPFGNNVRERVAATWALQDPVAAMEWVSKSPPGAERDKAVKSAFRIWRREDPEGLRSWASAMGPEGVEPWFMPAVGAYAVWLAWENGEEAVRWAELVPEPTRELVLITVARRWRDWDKEAADAWLNQSSLSKGARKRARTVPYMWKKRREQLKELEPREMEIPESPKDRDSS